MALDPHVPATTTPPPASGGLFDALHDKAQGQPAVQTCVGCQQVANNQSENKMFRAICKKLRLSPTQAQMLHLEITGQGMSYSEVYDAACDIKLNYPNK